MKTPTVSKVQKDKFSIPALLAFMKTAKIHRADDSAQPLSKTRAAKSAPMPG
ncbi:MAG: hypothetical protein WCQ60_03925 [bacterium]